MRILCPTDSSAGAATAFESASRARPRSTCLLLPDESARLRYATGQRSLMLVAYEDVTFDPVARRARQPTLP
jgi:hypothetical protein